MFDDRNDHVILNELTPPSNYIVIKSRDKANLKNIPFQFGVEEITDYRPIQDAFTPLLIKHDNTGSYNNSGNSPNFNRFFKNNTKGGVRKISRRFITRSKKLKLRRKKQTLHRKKTQRGAGEKCIVYGKNGSIKDTWDCGTSCNYDGIDRCKPYE
jgi:hypothetical protein